MPSDRVQKKESNHAEILGEKCDEYMYD